MEVPSIFKVFVTLLLKEIKRCFSIMEPFRYQDFLPTHTQDTHENFTFVMDKAARWAAEQTDISLSYMQAVFIKKKGNIFFSLSSTW